MANALLDFVMSLVRDPDAAARYAADPAGAIAEAHLTDVTSADVQNLIPVVTESMSMSMSMSSLASSLTPAPGSAAPAPGWESLDAEPAGNVWTSGAATAAFDAFGDFGDQLPEPAGFDADPAVPTIVDRLDPTFETLGDDDVFDPATSLQLDDPVADDAIVDHVAAGTQESGHWAQPAAHQQIADDAPGFDLFD